MGKKARLFPSGELKLHTPKKIDKSKQYPIYFYYNWHRNKVTRQTGFYAKIDDWDEKNGKLRRQYGQDYQQVNNQLANRIKHYDAIIADYAAKHPHQLTLQVIRAILDDKALTRKDKGCDFYQFVTDYLQTEYKKNKVSWSRTKNGISTMNGFRQFLQFKQKGSYKEDAIYLGEISDKLIGEYIVFRQEYRHNTIATINHALTPIIKACRYAAALELIDAKTANLIEDCRIAEKENYDATIEEFDGKYLNAEQLKLLTIYCDEGRCHTFRQKEYIAMFLFAFHACGMRISDVITLKWKHIDFIENDGLSLFHSHPKVRLFKASFTIIESEVLHEVSWKHVTTTNNTLSSFIHSLSSLTCSRLTIIKLHSAIDNLRWLISTVKCLQKLSKFSRLYLFSYFISIFKVLNKEVVCYIGLCLSIESKCINKSERRSKIEL